MSSLPLLENIFSDYRTCLGQNKTTTIKSALAQRNTHSFLLSEKHPPRYIFSQNPRWIKIPKLQISKSELYTSGSAELHATFCVSQSPLTVFITLKKTLNCPSDNKGSLET